jgi:hypothetical protein
MVLFGLPIIEILEALIVAVLNPGLTGGDKTLRLGALIIFSVGQNHYLRDALAYIETQMDLGLLRGYQVTGPGTGDPCL